MEQPAKRDDDDNFPSWRIALPAFVVLITVAIGAVTFVINMVEVPVRQQGSPTIALDHRAANASPPGSMMMQAQK